MSCGSTVYPLWQPFYLDNVGWSVRLPDLAIGLWELCGKNVWNFDSRCYSGTILGINKNNAGIITSSTQYGEQITSKNTVATYNAKSVFLTWN